MSDHPETERRPDRESAHHRPRPVRAALRCAALRCAALRKKVGAAKITVNPNEKRFTAWGSLTKTWTRSSLIGIVVGILPGVGGTMAEKLLRSATGRTVRAGEIVVCTPHYAMGTDGSIPMAIDYLAGMGASAPAQPGQLLFALDHYGISSGPNALTLQAEARKFAHDHGIALFDVGDGIGHQLLIEQGIAAPSRWWWARIRTPRRMGR